MTFALSRIGVPGDFCADHHSEVTEGFIEQFFIDFWVEIADKYVGSYVLRSFILGGLVDFERLSVKFDHVHDFDGIVCIFLTLKLDKAIPLVLIGDFIPGDMDIDHGPALREQLPEQTLVDLDVDIACVYGGFLIPLVQGWNGRHTLIIIKLS